MGEGFISGMLIDLPEQFKSKQRISDLVEVLGGQFQEVADFYEDIKVMRAIDRAEGKQLDGIGEIVVLTRAQAALLASGSNITFDVIDDERYRQFLKYKAMLNTNNCTYHDIISALRMFYEWPIYYSEDPAYPATMFLKTDLLTDEDDYTPLLTVPIIRPGGVKVILAVQFQPKRFHNPMTLHLPTLEIGITLSNFNPCITFDGRQVYDGTWAYNQTRRGTLMLDSLEVSAAIPNSHTLRGTLVRDNLFCFDGSWTYDGQRNYDAYYLEEEI